ncbi:MAG: hypothetical protein ABFC57_03385 [Veillonellales bacterium]
MDSFKIQMEQPWASLTVQSGLSLLLTAIFMAFCFVAPGVCNPVGTKYRHALRQNLWAASQTKRLA